MENVEWKKKPLSPLKQTVPGIPANSVLIFEVELLDVMPQKAEAKAGKDAKKNK